VNVTIRTYDALPPVIAGQHGKEAQFVLLRQETDMPDRDRILGGYSLPSGPPQRTLEFEVMPGSETAGAILGALDLLVSQPRSKFDESNSAHIAERNAMMRKLASGSIRLSEHFWAKVEADSPMVHDDGMIRILGRFAVYCE